MVVAEHSRSVHGGVVQGLLSVLVSITTPVSNHNNNAPADRKVREFSC